MQVLRRTFNRSLAALTITVASVIGSAAANADVAFYTSTGPFTVALNAAGLTDANVLFNEPGLATTGNPVQGNSNTMPTFLINFLGDVTLTTPAMGAARIEGSTTDFTDLTISLADPNGCFQSLSFEINPPQAGGRPTTLGPDTISLVGIGLDQTVYNLPISSNGLTFFGVIATNGQVLKSVSLSGNVAIDDVRQVRIGGLGMMQPPPPSEVPEPGTMALLGLGAAPLLRGLRRRRQA